MNTNDTNRFSLKHRIKSFSFAFNGLKNLILKEHNARIHFTALLSVIGLGIFLKIEVTEWISISIVSGIVILTELLNTAIERLADFVEPKWNKKIGIIKDYCAGAVLVSAITAMTVGGFVFIPKIIEIINNGG